MRHAEWRGVDTVIIVAGVSALQTLMVTAGVDMPAKGHPWMQASRDGVQRSVDIAAAATKGNYFGPLVAAITFVRVLYFFLYVVVRGINILPTDSAAHQHEPVTLYPSLFLCGGSDTCAYQVYIRFNESGFALAVSITRD